MTKIPLPLQLVLAGLLGMLALPVRAAAPKTPRPPDSGVSVSASSPPPSSKPISDRKPPPRPARPDQGSQVAGPKTVARRPDETPEQFAARILSPGNTAITKPLELELPPLGKVVLVLYDVVSDDPAVLNDPSVYRGLVLVPDGGAGSYRIERLPSQKEGAGTVMYGVLSVFAADADGDGAPEVCILYEITRAGAGDRGKSHTDTDLFKWSGSAFALVRQSDKRPLYDLRDAKAVRAKLKKMHAQGVAPSIRPRGPSGTLPPPRLLGTCLRRVAPRDRYRTQAELVLGATGRAAATSGSRCRRARSRNRWL